MVAPLRIVGLCSHNGLGGAQTALGKLLNAFAARGHNTEFWFLYRTRAKHESSASNGRLLLPHTARGVADYLRAALALYRELRRERPDALVSFLPLANVLGQSLAALAGIPARVASQRNPGWTYSQPMQILDRIAGTIGIYGRTVCVSDAVRESFRQYPVAYRRRLMVVPNGLELCSPGIHKAAARQSFGLPSEAFLAIAVGRLCAQKNLTLMLDAVARVPDVVLVIVGDGEDRAMLEEQVKELGITDRVLFLGMLPPGSVPELLRAADVFVQPSRFEGQSNALLEAMAAALPVLASNIPSQREALVGDGHRPCGLLLPLDDPEQWARALQRLHADVEERLELGCAAVARSTAFTVERMAAGFEGAIVATPAGKHTIGRESSDRH